MKSIIHTFLYVISFYVCFAQSAPQIIVTNANIFSIGLRSNQITAYWTTLDSSQGAPAGNPYALGFRKYGFLQNYITQYSPYAEVWWAPNPITQTQGPIVAVTPEDTWASLTSKFTAQYGSSGSATWKAVTTDDPNAFIRVCIAAYKATVDSTIISSNGGNISTSFMIDPGTCSTIAVTPDPTTCDIVGPNTIAHGTINAAEVNGYSTAINATVTCSAAATIGFRILNQSINVGNGITSQLKVNGSATPSTINVTQSIPKTITISSTLQATNPTAGTISGSSTIIVDVQ